MTQSPRDTVTAQLRHPLLLTRAGLWAERVTRSFWPLWTVLIGALAVLAFGLQDLVPLPAATTEKPAARAQSTISQINAGWSP